MQAGTAMITLPNFRHLQCRGHRQPRGGTAPLLCLCACTGRKCVPRGTHSDTADYATDAKVKQNYCDTLAKKLGISSDK